MESFGTNSEKVIAHKQAEYDFIIQELEKSVDIKRDPNFEYASSLMDVFGAVQHELNRLVRLTEMPDTERNFPFYFRQFMFGSEASLSLNISIRMYEYNGPLLIINKMKTKSKVKCILTGTHTIYGYKNDDTTLKRMKKNGWHGGAGKKPYFQNFRLATEDELTSFFAKISFTLFEEYGGVIQYSKDQHYIFK